MRQETVTKVEAANRQLAVAITLYFDHGDIVATHTLAGAAREIYERHCEIAKLPRMYDEIQANNPDLGRTEIFKVLNHARNFIKHHEPTGNLNATVDITDDDNKMTIFIAAFDCASLLDEETPPLVRRYLKWFVATEPGYREWIPELDEQLPGMHTLPEEAQRAIGKEYVV